MNIANISQSGGSCNGFAKAWLRHIGCAPDPGSGHAGPDSREIVGGLEDVDDHPHEFDLGVRIGGEFLLDPP